MRDPMSVNWVLSPLLSLSLSCTVPENVTAYRQNTEDQSKREREGIPVYEDDKSLSDFLNKHV